MLFGVYVLWSCYSGKCLNKDNLLIYYIVVFFKKKKKRMYGDNGMYFVI